MSLGFKEWKLVCDALGRGEQSIILRKGGIAEGRAGFRFQHPEFLLFPTHFHEQARSLKLPLEQSSLEVVDEREITIRFHARVEWTAEITDLGTAQKLGAFHLWRDEIVAERFRYSARQSLELAFVRVARLSVPFIFPNEPKYGGCRSWVTLPELPTTTRCEDVLGGNEHQDREAAIHAILRS